MTTLPSHACLLFCVPHQSSLALRIPIVRKEWITESVSAGSLQPYAAFAVPPLQGFVITTSGVIVDEGA
jgi:hypothetical protein